MSRIRQAILKCAAGMLALSLLFLAAGCGPAAPQHSTAVLPAEPSAAIPAAAPETLPAETPAPELARQPASGTAAPAPASAAPSAEAAAPLFEPEEEQAGGTFSYADVPPYSGAPYVSINSNRPFFEERQITATGTERYSALDGLGRCGPAWASVGLELMPQGERGDISSVTPSGWKQAKVDGAWLYNRCHLIGYQLTAEDARPQNLITGTRYLNIEGMLPFENMVADYVKETENHVMYRATPVFVGDELVCRGVLMEGMSVEDGGEGICFCVFAYNVQPGVELSYADGSIAASTLPVTDGADEVQTEQTAEPVPDSTEESAAAPVSASYIGNKNTGKFHHSWCSSVDDMKESNKVPLSSAAEALAEGYVPCKRCKP